MNSFSQYFFPFLLFFGITTASFAQTRKYTVANAHAHNDYIHPLPFYTAYNAGFGSIEADIFLRNGRLYVAHDTADIDVTRTLESLYLNPLMAAIKKNKGKAYANGSQLILLIDLKTEAVSTLDALIRVLRQYQTLTTCKTLKLVITGNQPDASRFASYPSFIFFDGKLNVNYTQQALKRVQLFSEDFRKFSQWKGDGTIPAEDHEKIGAAVAAAHKMHRPIRFWAAPDHVNAWRQLMELDVDYLNTDKIPEIAIFLLQLTTKEN
jgi:alkaline phosphatase